MTNDPFSFEKKEFPTVHFFGLILVMGHVCFSVNVVLSGPIVEIIMKGSKKGLVNETGLVF